MSALILQESKMLPHSVEIELSILSAIMIDRTAMSLVRDLLSPEMFYVQKHHDVYDACCWLYDRQHPTGTVEIMEQLNRRNLLDVIGGPFALTEIESKTTSSANIEYHATVITELFLKRRLINECSALAAKAYRNDVDAFEVLGEMAETANDLNSVASGGAIAHIGEIAEKLVESIAISIENDGVQPGTVYTGTQSLDEVLGGMQPGDFGIIAARPGMGKTTFAQQLARKSAIAQQLAVALFSLEMTESQVGGGMILAEAEINKNRLRQHSKFTDDELIRFRQEVGRFNNYPIYISDKGGATINQIRAGVKSAKMRAKKDGHELGIVLIDYLQLMRSIGNKGNREQEVSGISKALKQMAKDEGVPVVALSQLSRAVETRGGDKRPQLSDLRESGSLEQDADWVLFLYRPEYYKIMEDEQGNSLKGVTEIIVGKNRHGEAKDVLCSLDLKTGVFTEKDIEFDIEDNEPDQPYSPNIKPETVKSNDDEDIPF